MSQISLPLRARVTEGRVSVTSSRLLMFNRVAKVMMVMVVIMMMMMIQVGSSTLIRLLRTLGEKNGYTVSVDNRAVEVRRHVTRDTRDT